MGVDMLYAKARLILVGCGFLLCAHANADLLKSLPDDWLLRIDESGAEIYESSSEKITVRAHGRSDLESIALELLKPARPTGNPPGRDSFSHVGTAKGRSYLDMSVTPWKMYQVYVMPSTVNGTISVYSEYPVASALGLITAKRHEKAIEEVERLAVAGDPVLAARSERSYASTDTSEVEQSKVEAAGRDIRVDTSSEAARNNAGAVKVEGVYQTTRPPIYIGTGGWSYSEDLYVFFENGVVRDGLNGAPEHTDFSERARAPSKWGRWSKIKNGADVVWDDGKRETLGKGSQTFALCKPGPSDPLTGRYQKTISPLGYSRVLLRSTGDFSMNYTPGGQGIDGDREGTYAFQGYTLVLDLSDGQTERYGACFPGRGYDMMYLNGLRLTKDG